MKRFYQYGLLIFFLFSILYGKAQHQSVKERNLYDSITYHYYLESNWDSVIDISKEALYKGYDFYFLRMRLGLAYDYQRNFRLAEIQYKKALNMVPSDINAAYYLYFSAINGGRAAVANKKYESFAKEQQISILKGLELVQKSDTISHKYLIGSYVEMGTSFTDVEQHKDDIFLMDNSILSSEGDLRYQQNYFNLQLFGELSPYVSWKASYALHQIAGVTQFQIKNYPISSAPLEIIQHDGYGELSFFSGDGWNFSVEGQFLSYTKTATDFWIDSIGYSEPIVEEDSILVEEVFTEHQVYSYSNTDYVFNVSLSKKVNILDLTAFAAYGSIGQTQNPFQIGGEVSILPNGSYDLYLTNRLFWFHDDLDDRTIYKVIAGGKIYKKFGFEAAATFGNIQYTKELHQPIFYNWSDETKFKGDLMLSYRINPHLTLAARYQLTQKTGKYLRVEYDGISANTDFPGYYQREYKAGIDAYQFKQHFILLSINWVF